LLSTSIEPGQKRPLKQSCALISLDGLDHTAMFDSFKTPAIVLQYPWQY
jgi:hypothetical protein